MLLERRKIGSSPETNNGVAPASTVKNVRADGIPGGPLLLLSDRLLDQKYF